MSRKTSYLTVTDQFCGAGGSSIGAKKSGVEVRMAPEANSVLAKITKEWLKPLREESFFYVWDEKTFECRWMTSWDTQLEDIL